MARESRKNRQKNRSIVSADNLDAKFIELANQIAQGQIKEIEVVDNDSDRSLSVEGNKLYVNPEDFLPILDKGGEELSQAPVIKKIIVPEKLISEMPNVFIFLGILGLLDNKSNIEITHEATRVSDKKKREITKEIKGYIKRLSGNIGSSDSPILTFARLESPVIPDIPEENEENLLKSSAEQAKSRVTIELPTPDVPTIDKALAESKILDGSMDTVKLPKLGRGSAVDTPAGQGSNKAESIAVATEVQTEDKVPPSTPNRSNREGGNSFGSWLTFAFFAALLGTAARMGAAPGKSAGVVKSNNVQGRGSDLYGQATLPSLPEEVPSTFPTDTYWEVADKERGMLEPAWNLHGFLGVGLSDDKGRGEHTTPADQISQPIGISTPRDEHYPLEWDLDSFLGWSDSNDKVNAREVTIPEVSEAILSEQTSDASITYSDTLKPLNQPEYTPVIPQVKEEVVEQLELYLKEEGELGAARYSALREAVEEAKEGNYAKLGTALAHILKGKTVNPWGININNELYFVTSHFENESEISLSLHNLLQNMNLVATGENSGVRLDDKDYLNFSVSLREAFEQISTRGDRYPRDLIAIAMSICYNPDYTPRSEEEKAKLLDEYKEALKSFREGHIQKQDDYKLFLAIADQAEMLAHFHGILPKKQQQEQVIVSEVAATPAPILEETPGIGLDFAQNLVKEFLPGNGISIKEIGEKALEVLKKSERYEKVEHLITSLHAAGEDELSQTYKMFTYLEVLKEAVNAQKDLGYLETMGLESLENSLKVSLSELEDLRKGNYDKILWGPPKTNALPGEDKTYQQQCPIREHIRPDWAKFLSEEDKARISALESSIKENWDTFNNDQKLSTVLLIQTIRRELSLFVYNDNRLLYTPWIKEEFGKRIGDLLTRIEKVVENREAIVEVTQQEDSKSFTDPSIETERSILSESLSTISELSEAQNVTTTKDSSRPKADEERGDGNSNNSNFYNWMNGLGLAASAVGALGVAAFPSSEMKTSSAPDISNSNAAESVAANQDELEAQSTQEVPAVENVPAQDIDPGALAVESIATNEVAPETSTAQGGTLENRASDANQAADPSTQVGERGTPEERAPEIDNKSGSTSSRAIGSIVGGTLGVALLGGLGYALAATFLVGAMSAFPPIAICAVAALTLGAIGVAAGMKAGDKAGAFIEQYRNEPSKGSPGR